MGVRMPESCPELQERRAIELIVPFSSPLLTSQVLVTNPGARDTTVANPYPRGINVELEFRDAEGNQLSRGLRVPPGGQMSWVRFGLRV